MKENKPIEFQVGFAHSEILDYLSKDGNLIIHLKCWNNEIVRFEFFDCAFFLILSHCEIYDVCESDNSILMNKALKMVYETIPQNHPYKLFCFLNNDGDSVVEIGCKNLKIELITKSISEE